MLESNETLENLETWHYMKNIHRHAQLFLLNMHAMCQVCPSLALRLTPVHVLLRPTASRFSAMVLVRL